MSVKQELSGNFAPPITDAKMDAYKAAIESLPADSRTRDRMQMLYDCVAKWWDLPDPGTGAKRFAHPVGERKTVRGKLLRAPTVTVLESDHADTLDPLIPWEAELKDCEELFDALEVEATKGNEEKCEAWRRACKVTLATKLFAGIDEVDFHLYQSLQSTLDFGSDIEKKAACRIMDKFGITDAMLANHKATVEEYQKQVHEACHIEGHPVPIPEPIYEPTPVRDAAQHLLWTVKELNSGREPVFNDQL